MIPDRDLIAEVAQELTALHWSSEGNGATVAEIVAALEMRGVPMPRHQRRWLVAKAMECVPHRRMFDGNGDEVLRGDHVVFVPVMLEPVS